MRHHAMVVSTDNCVRFKYETQNFMWKNCVCVRVDRVGLPHLIPCELLFIQQNPHQLRNGHGWVSVIQLDGDLNMQNIIKCQYRF